MKTIKDIDRKSKVPEYDYLFNDEEYGNKNKKRLFMTIVKANLGGIILSSFVYIFQALPEIISPLIIADIINWATERFYGETPSVLLLILGISILFISILLNIPFTILRWNIVSKMIRQTSAKIKSSVVRKLQKLSITYYKDMESGRIQAKFLKDMDSIDSLLSCLMFAIIPDIISAVISFAIAIYKNGYVALFFLFVIPINVLVSYSFRKKIMNSNKDFRIKNEDMSAHLNTMLEMITVTKSHGLQAKEILSFQKNIDEVTKSGIKVDKVHAKFGSTIYVVNNILSCLCLLFCTFLALKKIIGIGDIVLYRTMFLSLTGQLTAIINLAPQISKGVDAVNSIGEIMNSEEIECLSDDEEPININGNIEFKNVYYRYPNTIDYTINDISFNIKQGECIAFVGESGSGKSTIMNMIIGFLLPTSGSVYIDNQEITSLNLTGYRKNISVVPQNSILFSGSIRDNITYGLDHYTQEDLNKVIETANLKDLIEELPNGLDTIIGEHGDKLSGGQKQRITIARALIRNPKILILDEATSALDNISEFKVQKAIDQSITGRTTLIVAHRLSTIRNANRIFVLHEGKCIESGTYEELINKKGAFYELKKLSDINMKEAETNLNL